MSGPQFNQLLPNPIGAALEGFQGAQQIRQNQLKQQLLEQEANRTKQMNEELSTLSQKQNITSDDIGRTIIKYPILSDDLRKAFGTMSPQQQNSTINQLVGLDLALQKGDIDSAKTLLNQQREAALNSGDKQREVGAQAMLMQLDFNPKAAAFAIGSNLATIMGVKEFSEYRKNLQSESKKDFRILTKEEKKNLGLDVKGSFHKCIPVDHLVRRHPRRGDDHRGRKD